MMLDDAFLSNLLANMIVDLLVGTLIGVSIAWWVGKNLNLEDRISQRKAEQRANRIKAQTYLELLRSEIAHLVSVLPSFIEALNSPSGTAMIVNTDIWDAIQPGGELPRLIDPMLLSALALFYGQMRVAQMGTNLTMQAWNGQSPTRSGRFVSLARSGFEMALKHGEQLLPLIDKELSAIKSGLAKEH